MKMLIKNIKTATGTALFIGMAASTNAQSSSVQNKLEYMIGESPERIFDIAKAERKPVLMYIHSQTCYSSRKFSRDIMNHEKVKNLVRKRFVCMNADVATKFGNSMAIKHKILIMPAIVLYSPDKGIMFQCHLKLDTFEMMTEFRAFVSAYNLIEQLALNKATTSLTEKEALRAIGRSYADKDFKRDVNGSLEDRIKLRTLNIAYFKEFEEGYKEEWGAMLVSNRKKMSGKQTASRR